MNNKDFWFDELCQIAHLEAIKLIRELINTLSNRELGLLVCNFDDLRGEVIESYVQVVGEIQDELSAVRYNHYSLRIESPLVYIVAPH